MLAAGGCASSHPMQFFVVFLCSQFHFVVMYSCSFVGFDNLITETLDDEICSFQQDLVIHACVFGNVTKVTVHCIHFLLYLW